MKELLLFGMLLANREASPDAAALHNLGARYYYSGNFTEAENLYNRALTLWKSDREAAATLNNLGALYRLQGRYNDAEACYLKALRALPENESAKTLANLAELYRLQNRLPEAKANAERSAVIARIVNGPDSPQEAQAESVLAGIERAEGHSDQALARYRRIARVLKVNSVEPALLSATESNITSILIAMGKFNEAEPVARESVSMAEKLNGPMHPNVATALNNLAQALRLQGKTEEPEGLYRRALTIWKTKLGDQHPDYARGLSNMADYYVQLGRYSEAEDLYHRAKIAMRKSLGTQHPETLEASRGLNAVYAAEGYILPFKAGAAGAR